MAAGQVNRVMHHLRTLARRQDVGASSDGQLLEGFIARRDEAAFAELVRRHGPMVLGVCRRVLGNAHDADDAFQATFMVLVRRAGAVVPRDLVGNWLYGVAYRVALEARARAGRRRAPERQVPDMPQPTVPPPELWHDLRPVLDQELSRLPDKYRAALVLCDLEGKPRKEAARLLGVPEGTLSSRLATGRKLLAERLARHGLALTGAALAAALAENAARAGVSAALMGSTVKAAALGAVGPAVAQGVLSAQAAALTEGVMKTMLLIKLASLTALVLGLGVLTLGVGLVAVPADEPRDHSPSEVVAQASEAPKNGTPQQVIEDINRLIVRKFYTQAGGKPSDEELLRRISLDIRGVLPTPMEMYYFKQDKNPKKLAKAVELFLQGPPAKDEKRAAWDDFQKYFEFQAQKELGVETREKKAVEALVKEKLGKTELTSDELRVLEKLLKLFEPDQHGNVVIRVRLEALDKDKQKNTSPTPAK
jgi:RNA polymerase sigma factor (sigma-70 family)